MIIRTERDRGIIALILNATIVSLMGVYIRYLNEGFSVLQQVYLRIFLAFLFGLLLFYKDLDFLKLRKISRNEWLLLVFRSICLYLIGVTYFTKAVILTKLSNVLFIQAFPITAILGFIILKERFTLEKTLLIIISFLGIVLVSVKDYSGILTMGRGEVLALFSIIAISITYVTRKMHSGLLNDKEITLIMFLIAFISVFLLSVFTGEDLMSIKMSMNLFLLLIIAGFSNTLLIFLLNFGFKRVQAVLANTILNLEALFGIFVGFFFLKELIAVKELFGGVLIVVSAVVMNQLVKSENRSLST